MRIRNIFRADRVVGPYYAFRDSVENFERPKLRGKRPEKPKGSSGRFKEARREIELPPGRKFLI